MILRRIPPWEVPQAPIRLGIINRPTRQRAERRKAIGTGWSRGVVQRGGPELQEGLGTLITLGLKWPPALGTLGNTTFDSF